MQIDNGQPVLASGTKEDVMELVERRRVFAVYSEVVERKRVFAVYSEVGGTSQADLSAAKPVLTLAVPVGSGVRVVIRFADSELLLWEEWPDVANQ